MYWPCPGVECIIMQAKDTGENKQPLEHRSWKFKPINLKVMENITPVRLTVGVRSIKANYTVIAGIDANSVQSSVSLLVTWTILCSHLSFFSFVSAVLCWAILWLIYIFITVSVERRVRKEKKLNKYRCLLASWCKSRCSYQFLELFVCFNYPCCLHPLLAQISITSWYWHSLLANVLLRARYNRLWQFMTFFRQTQHELSQTNSQLFKG